MRLKLIQGLAAVRGATDTGLVAMIGVETFLLPEADVVAPPEE